MDEIDDLDFELEVRVKSKAVFLMTNQTEQLDQIWLTVACDPINQLTTICGFSESETEADEYEQELTDKPEFEFSLIKSFLFVDTSVAGDLYVWFLSCGMARGQAKETVIQLIELMRDEIEEGMKDD